MAFGETLDEALETLGDVKQSWLELAIEREWTIPEPTTEEKEYSGRFNVRLPRYLHRELAEIAEAEETSLNQLVVALLSDGVGRRSYAGRRTRSRTVKPFPQAEWASLCSWILKPLDRQKRVRETTPNALYWQMVDALQLASEPE
jgi:hypothetical protein